MPTNSASPKPANGNGNGSTAARTPYPPAFLKGMLHGLAARLLPANTKLDVREGRGADRTLTLDVRW
ncbi:MAG: hypothetical protein DYG88_05855 [Chloroflexi bacterium CFX4]|nr:hypothetical protein [Chloroflexi bacterium CFX4]MDL1922864.1 hypothetical protein [Chloroflexi bacterium CFX3]